MDFTFLEGLDHRLKFLAMAEAIVRRSGRDMELERMFDTQELDSLILATLVYIMEETLAENRECSLADIEQFLGSLLALHKPSFPADRLHSLAEYIVKEVLQNDGQPRYYTLLHPEKGFQQYRVDFLSDPTREEGSTYRTSYQLTDQSYEFLFRTKEVENELRFTMEELKLRELIRRKNYGKAVRQSASLTQMIRQKKRELNQFQDQVKDNILTVDVGDYENLIKSTFDLLTEEYGMMQEIREMLHLAFEHIQEEEKLHNGLDAEMQKAMSEMERIHMNLDMAVSEQRAMILQRHSISDVYARIMKEAFSQKLLNRFDFEEEILKPMETVSDIKANNVFKLLNPLFLPDFKQWLSISAIYQPQAKLKQQEEHLEGILDEQLSEDLDLLRVKQRNTFHIFAVEELLGYSSLHLEGFRLNQWISHLQTIKSFSGHLDYNALFQMLLCLYEAGEVDILSWLDEKPEVAENASGEFDLEYCLYNIQFDHADMFGIGRILINKPDEQVFTYTDKKEADGAFLENRLVISDFLFSVEGADDE
ncbi:MAG TPA: hypothetical protein DD738_09940 [Ruminiclostridium sp.]|nr:hypothetical protein [Ruminiclostridium sp.]